MNTVAITEDETIISLTFNANHDYSRTVGIGVYPPGHDMAFYITDVRKSQKYFLLDAEGIAIKPNGNKLRIGESIKFNLVFEKIPMMRFHLIEGVTLVHNESSWHFTNVKLK